jgi:hypothetical protein
MKLLGQIWHNKLNFYSPREIRQVATGLLAECRLKLALIGGGGRGDSQKAAGSSVALASGIVGIITLVNSILKCGGVPAVLEIGVEGKAGRVAMYLLNDFTMNVALRSPSSPNEWPSVGLCPLAGKILNIPGDLIEEFHQVNGMGRGANAIIETVEVCYVGGVGGRVQILEEMVNMRMGSKSVVAYDTIPTGGHVNTRLETSLTGCVGPTSIYIDYYGF